MQKEIINTNQAPAAIGPYVQATRLGDLVFTSGQIPLDPATMTLVTGSIEVQAEQVGANAQSVVKTTCFLKNMEDFTAFNAVYAQYLGEAAPARSCVEVARLPKDVLVEVEAIAHVAA